MDSPGTWTVASAAVGIGLAAGADAQPPDAPAAPERAASPAFGFEAPAALVIGLAIALALLAAWVLWRATREDR
ncbi:MAG: hypothetical protein RMK74_11015 [Myxococcales bacterium]|nr:hypothetical protein [Myxococcales bacterium]